MRKLHIAFVLVITVICMSFGIPVMADSYTELNINEGRINITEDGNYHIIGNGTEASNNITVNAGVNANIILENVNIAAGTAFKIADNSTGNVSIELLGENKLISSGGPGICKNGDGDNIGTLTITGSGSLHAENTGTDGAGIGSDNGPNTRNIVINGGTVTAIAGSYGAGIGGGGGGGCASDITINGGTITAIGGISLGAGIGGGSDYFRSNGDATRIVITGGNVTATARGTGAGIGGGYGSGSDIVITGGIVTATGSSNAADIGGNKPYNSGDGRLIQTIEVLNNSGSPATNNIANFLIYSDKKYTVNGNITLDFDLIVESDETLVINKDAKLTVASNLINNGILENNGTIFETNGHSPTEDDGDCTTPIRCKVCQEIIIPAKTHKLSELQYEDSSHWYNCENENCTQVIGKEKHKISDWIIDEEATAEEAGKKHKECTVCHYVMETEEIPKGNTVKTGDESDFYVYVGLMVAALAGCAFVLKKGKWSSNK